MEDKKYVKALDIKEMEHIEPGHTIKLYGEETTVQAFYAAYNEGLGRWETIILTDGRGDPFERSLDVIEVLPDQPWNHPLPPGATILPTNEQVSTWFEENIDKECSASSAIYKFRQWLKSLPAEPKRGPVWVKASDLKIEYGKNYYAQWLDGKLKAIGWFQESDGTFFWNVPGYIPIGKHEYERLSILDESAPSGEREVGSARYELSLALRSILRMIRHMPLKRDEQKRYEAAEAMLNKHASIYDVLRTGSKEGSKEMEINEAFIEWACLHYTPYYKGNKLVAWKGYVADGDEIGLTTAQLYDIFKQQNRNNANS